MWATCQHMLTEGLPLPLCFDQSCYLVLKAGRIPQAV
jgi:hypothetical protein